MLSTDRTQTVCLNLFDGGEGAAQSAPPADAADGATAPADAAPDAAADKRAAFRALIRGAYREQYAEETQKLINRRFRETEALRQRVAQLEGERAGETAAEEENTPHQSARPSLPASPQGEAIDASAPDAAPALAPAPAPAPAPDAAAIAAQCAQWGREAAALAAAHPDFDLDALRADPLFALMLTHGVPMERAWRAATVDARERVAAAAAEKALADDIRAGGARPAEAGGGHGALALRPDAAHLSDGEVREVLARLSRRERVSFG